MTVEAYCGMMLRGGRWGGGIELAAFAQSKKVNVHVFERRGSDFVRIAFYRGPTATGQDVHVLYVARSHYDLLVGGRILEAPDDAPSLSDEEVNSSSGPSHAPEDGEDEQEIDRDSDVEDMANDFGGLLGKGAASGVRVGRKNDPDTGMEDVADDFGGLLPEANKQASLGNGGASAEAERQHEERRQYFLFAVGIDIGCMPKPSGSQGGGKQTDDFGGLVGKGAASSVRIDRKSNRENGMEDIARLMGDGGNMPEANDQASDHHAFWESFLKQLAGLPDKDGSSSSSSGSGADAEEAALEPDVMSDDDGMSHSLEFGMEKNKPWTTVEDQDIDRIEALALELRERPLLPPYPGDASRPWTDVTSGIAFPV